MKCKADFHNASVSDRYACALRDMPASGGGGCHSHLLGIANYGVRSGLSDQDMLRDIRSAIHGTRIVPDKEIVDAIQKARQDYRVPFPRNLMATVRRKPETRIVGKRFLDYLIKTGRDVDEVDIWESSPVRIDWPREDDTVEMIARLYQPDDMIFLGARHVPGMPGQTIRTSSKWIAYFKEGGHTVEHIMPNPLTGVEGRTKGGKPSYRSDDCVKTFRYAIVEFDDATRADQVAFWWSVNLPVVALIDSGGKSIHGWVKVDCDGADDWTSQVEERLFRELLIPMGVDGSCRNESRLSRLPGHKRKDTNRWQRLLYLAPDGRRVSP